MRLDGGKVREARRNARLTQADVSSAVATLGIRLTQTRISNIETGDDSNANELEATVLAAVLTQPLSAILPPAEDDDLPARAEQAAKLLGDAQALLRGEPGQENDK